MNAKQSKMARAGLGWSASDLANAAGLGYATVARFESGGTVADGSREEMRKALEKAGAQFTQRGGRIGASVPDN